MKVPYFNPVTLQQQTRLPNEKAPFPGLFVRLIDLVDVLRLVD
jgi:hypothetical protein